MSKKISFNIAMPYDGEGVEKLNADKFEKEIFDYLNGSFGDDVTVSVSVFQHDGTGVDNIHVSGVDENEDFDLTQRAEMLLPEAVNQAFVNPENYDA